MRLRRSTSSCHPKWVTQLEEVALDMQSRVKRKCARRSDCLSAHLFHSSHETVIVAVLSARHPSNVIICLWDKKTAGCGIPPATTRSSLFSHLCGYEGGGGRRKEGACAGAQASSRAGWEDHKDFSRGRRAVMWRHNDTHGHHSVPGWLLQRSAAHRKNPRRLLHDTNSTLKTEVDASALHFRVTAALRLEVT